MARPSYCLPAPTAWRIFWCHRPESPATFTAFRSFTSFSGKRTCLRKSWLSIKRALASTCGSRPEQVNGIHMIKGYHPVRCREGAKPPRQWPTSDSRLTKTGLIRLPECCGWKRGKAIFHSPTAVFVSGIQVAGRPQVDRNPRTSPRSASIRSDDLAIHAVLNCRLDSESLRTYTYIV